jgi:very-short-patch-repair endonuclease
MARIRIIRYNSRLKNLSRKLRLNSTRTEIILWKYIKGRVTGYQFHRQLPVDEYILDFYCHELKLAIEIDGCTHDYNFENDEIRQNRIESLGIRVLRFSDEDVNRHLNDVLRALQNVINEIESADK